MSLLSRYCSSVVRRDSFSALIAPECSLLNVLWRRQVRLFAHGALTMGHTLRSACAALLLALLLLGCENLPVDQQQPFGSVEDDGKPLSVEVSQALANSPQTTNLRITVQSEDDVVKLKGGVNNPTERWMAEEVAAGVDGVRFVQNSLFVRE